ncbi:zinc finger protein 423-like [Culicoides brevitarsis]|uniref:zinc finger protein 423-like n=1 Tax=Culicoides brevitarsis TaxID=469753 RepID=UPI00307B99B9
MAQIKSRNCCVPSCANTHETCSSFFRFPQKEKDRKRWIQSIGLKNFEPNNNTFVCIRHFMERDIFQKADRKTGQKARLKVLSTPRLFLEPIKVENKTDESEEEPEEAQKTLKNTENQILNGKESPSKVIEAPKSPKPMELTLDAVLKSLRDQNAQQLNGKRKRAKLSLVLPLLKSVEIYSSDSDCEYEISLSVKKVSKKAEEASQSTNRSIEESIDSTPERPKAPKVPKIDESQAAEAPPAIFEDDVEDAVTPTVIPRPKCVPTTNSSPNMHPKKRNYKPPVAEKKSEKPQRATNLILPPKKNYSNIMVASINDDGTIVEEMEELVTTPDRHAISEIQVSASQDDLSQLIEVDFSGTMEETPVANNLPPAELLQNTPDASAEQDTDDETSDGRVRICYECVKCKEMILSTKKTIRHLRQSHGLTIDGTQDLKLHTKEYPYKNFRMVSGGRAFTCSVCLMLYYNVQSLKKHQMIMHASMLGLGEEQPKPPQPNSNIKVCHVCQSGFLEEENLRSHLLLHANGKTDEIVVYKCEECGLGFEYAAALNQHTQEHHQTVKVFTCEYCMNAFLNDEDLVEHIQNHLLNNDQIVEAGDATKISQMVIQCPEDKCDLQFNDSNTYYSHILYTHRKVYQDDPRFIEYIQMVDPDTLNEKRVKTSGTQPKFNCRICDRKFSHYSFLKAHEAGKNKFKYECSECDEKTPSKVCLVRHYNVRHDKNIERLHFCTDCPKSFPKKAELLTHINTHRNDRQTTIHHCNLDGCDRIFADQTTYNYHLSRLHHSGKSSFVCQYNKCNQAYRHETLLKQHVNEAHLPKDHQETRMKNLHAESFSGQTTSSSSTKEQNIFFGHSDKYVNGTMDFPDSLMPEVLNDVCNEVTIYTDF